MGFTFLPKEFESIGRLERVLMSRRILFKKMPIIPKGKCVRPKVAYAIFQSTKFSITVNHFQDRQIVMAY